MKHTKIYLVTNCYCDPNKVYIGKTINSRESNHKKTYGEQIQYTYIDEINSLDRKDWEPLETYWIEQFRAWGFIIVNKRKKGGGGLEFMSNEQKDIRRKSRPSYVKTKISDALKGKKRTEEQKKELKVPKPEDVKQKMRESKIGVKRSEESKLKQSNTLKGREITWDLGTKGKNILWNICSLLGLVCVLW